MNKKLQKLKEVDWETKGGKVLAETALISEAVAGWTPVGGVVKYLATKGADMLVPPVTNEEIKRLLEQLQNVPESVTDVRNLIEEKIQTLQQKLDNPQPELRTDFQNLKVEMWASFEDMKRGNNLFLLELSDMKILVKKTFLLVVNLTYKVLNLKLKMLFIMCMRLLMAFIYHLPIHDILLGGNRIC